MESEDIYDRSVRMDLDDDYLDEYYYYNEEEDEDDVPGWNNNPHQGNYCGFRPAFLYPHNYNLPTLRYITPEEADRNARKLLEEEEKEKEKADKKRLKKKRQKDRKRQQKLQEAQNGEPSLEEKAAAQVTRSEDGQSAQEEEEQRDRSVSASDDELDLGSTFVRQAQKKMENKPKAERRERREEPSRERAPRPGAQPPQPPPPPPNSINILDRFKIQESLDLANIGNNLVGQQRFSEALHYYTEALTLNPSEYRFLGNRSYVYDHLGRYKESLADAENALQLQPHFLKGHFRKGKALRGLTRYSEAISAFQQVLLFDGNHAEAAAEILQCQQKMQEAMTSTRVRILSSAPLSPPVTPPASGSASHNKVFVPRNIYNTSNKAAAQTPAITDGNKVGGVANVTTHSKLYPIWVGNVTNQITEDILRGKFERFGLIHSVRLLHKRTCAFINFTNKESAEAAFRSLQGLVVEGTTFVLQLRNPEHHGAGASRK